jgi:plasmid stabilization system protein ParE
MARARFSVGWAAFAEADLGGIVDYVARESAERALAIVDDLERRARSLERFPLHGRVVPELSAVGVEQFRELVVAPFRIVYEVNEAARRVHVVAVVDGRRDLRDILLRRLHGG